MRVMAIGLWRRSSFFPALTRLRSNRGFKFRVRVVRSMTRVRESAVMLAVTAGATAARTENCVYLMPLVLRFFL